MSLLPIQTKFELASFVKGYTKPVDERDMKTEQYINALFNHVVPITLTNQDNQQYLDKIMKNVELIPQLNLPMMDLNTDVFTAEPIKTKKDDTKEIKAEIRKINKKCACHTCDHTRLDKLKIQYVADVRKLRESENLNKVNRYFESLAKVCHCLVWIETDEEMIRKHKTFADKCGDKVDWINDKEYLKNAQQAAERFNDEALAFQAKYLATHCPKCEKLQKEYEFELKQIEEMREEVEAEREEEIKRIQEEIDNPPINDFMDKYFKSKDRIKVSDITKLWKAVNRTMIKQDEISSMLEETGKWKITNVHHVIYATKQ